MESSSEHWNRKVVLYPSDRVFKALFEPLFPRRVKPNHLTVFRMLLVPFVIYFLDRERYAVGVPLFLFAALTDWFDGALARCRRQISEWGILYDPLADKMLIGSVLFLIVFEHINVELGIALLAVEGALIAGGWYAHARGKVEPANIWGKIKMVSEVVGITLLLVALWSRVNLFVELSNGTLAVALVAALVSIFWRIR